MANALTGDFEAILQVSGSTVNRLLATMHQNPIAKPNLPTFPHSPTLRIGDDRALDGVRGTVKVQIGVPRIELLHGVSDRFLLEVAVRARYKPDPGTTPLPEFIHGTVRAEYRLQDIDHSCLGWSRNAGDYLWIRVIRSSVKFSGTAFDDTGPWLQTHIAAGQDVEALITKQVARQLAIAFAPGPHPVGKRFRRGSMRTLAVPAAGSAVCVPLGISGEPTGSIGSISNIVLEGWDYAIAINRDTILALVGPAVAAIGEYKTTVKIHVSTPWPLPDVDTVYRGNVNPPTVEWLPQGNHAIIKVRASGSARTDSILADATFDVEQDILVNFDGGGEVLWLSPGYHNVTVHASGLGHGTVGNAVKSAVSSAVKVMVQNACTKAQPDLDRMIARKQELIDQLRTIDDAATARFEDAQFVTDGMTLRGTIGVSPRQQPVLKFDRTTEEDGYSAFLSWCPGGRIDQFVWTWSWFGAGKAGSANLSDRFLLRRPRSSTSHWGGTFAFAGSTPLPGLDGMGTLCLTIKGVRIDRYTGALVPFVTRRECSRYGFPINVDVAAGGKLLWKTWPREPELSQDVPFPELAVMDVAQRNTTTPAANTLLLYVERTWDREIGLTIQEGLERSRRRDAGLQVVVLFREGVLTHTLASRVEALASAVGAPVLVNEDVHQTWSRRYGITTGHEDLAWRLISPGGGVTWMHDGRLHGEALTRVLDQALIPSRRATPAALRSGPGLGDRIVADALRIDVVLVREDVEPTCPPVPLNRMPAGSVVAFVRGDSAAAHSQLREINDRYQREREGQPFVAVVVDGADARTADALKRELDLELTVLPDAKGTISRRFGVRMWPTTVSLDREGVVSNVQLGSRDERSEPDERQTELED